MQLLSNRYDHLKALLARSETATHLDALEQTLRTHEQSIHILQEYIEVKGRETDYVSVKEACIKLTDELNSLHVRAQAMPQVAAALSAPY